MSSVGYDICVFIGVIEKSGFDLVRESGRKNILGVPVQFFKCRVEVFFCIDRCIHEHGTSGQIEGRWNVRSEKGAGRKPSDRN